MQPPPPKRRRIDALPSAAASRPAPKKTQAVAVPIPPPPDIDEQLFYQRAESQNKLKSAWESIFAKYERDTSDYADEIDLETGEIVVDKGHLRGLEASTETEVGEDLWANWVERDPDESEDAEEAVSDTLKKKGKGKGLANGKKKAVKAKSPKILRVAGVVYGITDCELCAEQDELDITPCTHGSSSSKLDEKENTPFSPRLHPQTPIATKKPLPPTSRIQVPVIDLDEEDDLSSATPVHAPGPTADSRPSGLTPALDILNINVTTSAVPQQLVGKAPRPSHLLPSSPILRHVNRKRPEQTQQHPPSSPPLASSPPRSLSSSSPPRALGDRWAPLADDPLADKTWHSHHPDGSPPRPRRGLLLFPTKPAPPPPLQFNAGVVSGRTQGSLAASPQQPSRAKGKNQQVVPVEITDEEELYSEDEESDRPITPVKIPVKPPAETPPLKKKPARTKSALDTKKTPTATPSKKSQTASTTATPVSVSKPKSVANLVNTPNPKPKTPAKTPAKTPVKAESKPLSKTPSKTAPKTPSIPPSKASSKTLARTPTSTLWSSQFTKNNSKKRKRVDDILSDSDSDIDAVKLSDDEAGNGLGILAYVKSRANTPSATASQYGRREMVKAEKVKDDLVKLEKGIRPDRKNFLAFYDTDSGEEEEGDKKKEDDSVVFLHQHSLQGNGNKATMTPSSSTLSKVKIKTKKTFIKQEEVEVKPTPLPKSRPKQPLPWVSKPQHTTPGAAPAPTTADLSDSRSLLLSAMGKVNRKGALCGTKGFSCGKRFCWECVEAEEEDDDHVCEGCE